MTRHLRWRKLVEPALQLKLVFTFACLTVLAMGLETLLLFQELTALAASDVGAGDELLALIPSILGRVVATTALVLVPLTLGVGVMATFRIAGPLYRIERYLEAVVRGEDPGDCNLREGDELQPLARLVTRATAGTRAAAATGDADDGDAGRRRAA